ncbi:single-stranded-DNA-specific exonuclease RecJ [Candidatus Berkelbacteria bacterium RIFCSPLOWO2_01_FULL_50_28]|uniref:Single-stranded-DNA-specific exonuclease RecJ n=1 Tax=Candidatus Berkelbacteria bacterium RIFCSPLOWO2_01_FULL_50_28 TaxID=1797471 RepID=A0A1F5EBG6_9BACT|nr:MAG: single-stranded-DNA-specific exonuclease RecJ [Candidatus Berkelbacteria bacterium RIFCSPHIGHO2_12_FULL_50_11]OGD64758.1 MAG: single-stranded-DNA-specific exonuclease RecJ [Candidatus Berkelbacteria bacterium RIFCSPLOWO2_01_FULL_50_28]
MKQAKWRVHNRRGTLINHLLTLRGFNSSSLEPDFVSGLHDPNLLPDMAKAREIVRRAVKENWPVAVFGDYDADGTPGAALLYELFERLGLHCTVFLPTRAEGYGLNIEATQKIGKSAKLLVLVDTGITAVESIAELKKMGVKTIILDHHLPTETLPDAEAIIDPFLSTSTYPFTGLCGCALAYKFAQALSADFPQISEGFLKWQLDLVAISTVADMMELTGENRVLVYYGLKILQKNRRLGLRALLARAALDPDKVTAGSIGFIIGPRLNAAGRLSDNRPAFELLVAKQWSDAIKYAEEIERANVARLALVDSVMVEAEAILQQQNRDDDSVIGIVGEAWPRGVIGLVAGRLAERHGRPTIIGSKIGDSIRASGRSVGQYHLLDGLTAVGRLLDGYGGHAQAAGMDLKTQNWGEFMTELKAHAKSMIGSNVWQPILKADCFIQEQELGLDTAQSLLKLEPHGLGNRRPMFIIENATLRNGKTVGNGKHLKGTLSLGQSQLPFIGFSLGLRQADLPDNADLIGHLTINEWNGTKDVQFQLVDIRTPGDDIEVVENAS